jgi:protoporphyrinogen/coproporphyrinogen III oxidase
MKTLNKIESIGSIDFNKKIHIYGAGMAGLLIGYYLKKAGREFVIFENSEKAGGKIQTINTDYGIAETAANAIYANDDVLELITNLKLVPVIAKKKLKKIIYRNKKAMSPPLTLAERIKILFSSFKKVKLTKPFQDYTLKEFFTPMLGENIVDNVLSAVYRGIYSIEANELHAASLYPLPKMNERYLFYFIRIMKERKRGSKSKSESISFKNGMNEFTQALVHELEDNLQFNKNVVLQKNSIVCTETYNASKLLKENYNSISTKLDRITYTKIDTTTIFTNEEFPTLRNGFGILFPSASKMMIMGILSNNNIFPGRSLNENTYSYTFITQKDADIPSELKQLNMTNKVEFHYKTAWDRAIPKYDITRYQMVQEIQNQLRDQSSLMLFGNYSNGISIREMISFAKSFSTSEIL